MAEVMIFADTNEVDRDAQDLQSFIRDGDRQALSRLVARYLPVMAIVARRCCDGPVDADDAIQQAVLGIMGSARDFRGRGSVRSWMLAVTAHAAQTLTRARRRRQHREASRALSELPAVKALPDGDADGSWEQIRERLAQLPAPYRLVITLRYLDGLSVADTAAAVGAPIKTVHTRLERGLLRLRLGTGQSSEVSAGLLLFPCEPVSLSNTLRLHVQSQCLLSPVPVASGIGVAALAVVSGGVIATALAVAVSVGAFTRARPRAPLPATAVLAAELGATAQAAPAAPPPAPVPALDEPSTAWPSAERVAAALVAPLDMRLRHDRLGEAMTLVQQCLPPTLSVPIIYPAQLIDEPWEGITLDHSPITLQEILDAFAHQGLRYRCERGGIVIDCVHDPSDLQLLTTSLTAGGAETTEAATALIRCGDANALRPLLVALSHPGQALAVAAVLAGAAVSQQDDREVMMATPSDPEVQHSLLAALHDPEVIVRVAAIIACGNLRLTAARAPLLTILAQAAPVPVVADPDAPLSFITSWCRFDERSQAAIALGRIGGDGLCTTLMQWLPTVEGCARGLGALHDAHAIPVLEEMVHGHLPSSDESGYLTVTVDALDAIGQIGGPEACRFYKQLAFDSSVPPRVIRCRTIAWLSQMQDGSAAAPMLELIQSLSPLMLGHSEQNLPFLESDTPQMSLYQAVTSAFCRLHEPSRVAALLELLKGQGVRCISLDGTSLGGDGATLVPALVARYAQPDDQGRIGDAVDRMLADLRLPQADRALLDHPPSATDAWSWEQWLSAVATLRIPQAQSLVLSQLTVDHPASTRRAAVACLALLRTDPALDLLLTFTADPDPALRRAALSGVVNFPGSATLPVIERLLHDPDSGIRATAMSHFIVRASFPTQSAVEVWLKSRDQGLFSEQDDQQFVGKVLCSQDCDPRLQRTLLEAVLARLTTSASPSAMQRLALIDMLRWNYVEAATHVEDRLRQLVSSDPDPQVRATAAFRLMFRGQDGLPGRRAFLQQELSIETDARVRRVLQMICDPAWRPTEPELTWPPTEALPKPHPLPLPLPPSHPEHGF
jgi:RNA polymerase sigma-70 factor (ECF subfamily)